MPDGDGIVELDLEHCGTPRTICAYVHPDEGWIVDPGPESTARTLLAGLPEEAVAYADEWIFERLRAHGLVLTDLHPGSWCGREEHMHFQDVLVAVRDAA